MPPPSGLAPPENIHGHVRSCNSHSRCCQLQDVAPKSSRPVVCSLAWRLNHKHTREPAKTVSRIPETRNAGLYASGTGQIYMKHQHGFVKRNRSRSDRKLSCTNLADLWMKVFYCRICDAICETICENVRGGDCRFLKPPIISILEKYCAAVEVPL
jgi:hypothetical protein